jgi:HlyD family secretion protein
LTKKAVIILSIIILSVVAISFLKRLASKDIDTKVIPVTVRKGDLRITIAEKGVIQPVRSAVLFSSIPGNKAKIIWMVPEGTFVKKGDPVIKFDETPFVENENKYAEELRQAEIEFKLKIDGDERIKKQELEIQKKKTRAMHEEHQKVTANMEELYSNGFITAEELRIARQKLQDYTYDQTIAEMKYETNQKNYPLVVDQALNRLAAVREKLISAKMERQASSLTAPVDGLVVYNPVPIEGKLRRIQIGDPVWQNQVIASIPEIANMAVILNIPEGRLHQVKIGQEAGVKVDAFPDLNAKGTVQQIGVLAKTEDRSSSVKTFEVTVLLNSSDLRLRPGMTASVSIISEELGNVLMVPHEAVFTEKGRYVCYLLKDNKLIPREVTVGKGNDDFVSITSGLSEGEEVSLINPAKKMTGLEPSKGMKDKSVAPPPATKKQSNFFD